VAEFVDFLLHLYHAQLASHHAASESAELFSVSAKSLFRSFSLRDVLDRKKEQRFFSVSLLDATAIEQHRSAPKLRELVFDLVIFDFLDGLQNSGDGPREVGGCQFFNKPMVLLVVGQFERVESAGSGFQWQDQRGTLPPRHYDPMAPARIRLMSAATDP
jgi:hypothetical protein